MLEESERTRIEIFRRVPLGLFRCSSSGRIIDANPALGEVLGCEPTDLLGRSIAELHAFADEWRGFATALESADKPLRFAHRWVKADGTTVPNLISLVAFLDVNPAGVNLIGAKSREDALVRVVPVDPPPSLLESFVKQFVAVWEDRDHLALEINGLTVDGQPLDLSLHWAATRNADGRLDASRVIVAITDIGVVRRAERELAALVASKGELVASVSHELRTPITTISGMAFELRDNASEFSPEETEDLINSRPKPRALQHR